ncbi:MAG: M20/M25/M40 family metallo-hydrolase [Bacteroidales bacterium]|nr:M20/M25/M40 family metallo-hydrolase [Bacteroidales bacterium]
MPRLSLFLLTFLLVSQTEAQQPDAVIRSIFNEALTDTTAYHHLRYITKKTRGRIPGSREALLAVEYTRQALIDAGADTVWLQEVTVPHWERGEEKAMIISDESGMRELTIAALGLSVGTAQEGLTAGVVEVHSFDELARLGKEKIEGKIVFFNRPVDNTLINTFAGYGGAVNQRTQGPSEASRYGAAAVIVRSVTHALNDFPHTGVTRYAAGIKPIPAAAVSTMDAGILSEALKRDPDLKLHLLLTCKNYPDTISYNVIGEIYGSSRPGEYITVGGHLDAWDNSEGAHDDAGGCVQSIEVIRLFKKLGVRPRRSVRAVMFMNEEMTGTGGREYAARAMERGEVHYAAIESDRGVMAPRGFTFDASGERLMKLKSLAEWFEPYNIRDFDQGGGGSDIAPLKQLGTLQIGYIPEIQRYFWYHHSANDTFEQVNIRELQGGSASMAALIYLLDIYGY